VSLLPEGVFYEVSSVQFGSNPATSFVVNSLTSITAIAPQDQWEVFRFNHKSGGTTSSSPPSLYTYTPPPPTITSFSPTFGPITGTNTVTIYGTNFSGVGYTTTNVMFGTNPATSFTVISPIVIRQSFLLDRVMSIFQSQHLEEQLILRCFILTEN